jgi:hypothetical protein
VVDRLHDGGGGVAVDPAVAALALPGPANGRRYPWWQSPVRAHRSHLGVH